MQPVSIDKVLVYETDYDANKGIELQRKMGYVCVSQSLTSVSSEKNTRVLEPRLALAFHKLTATDCPAHVTTSVVPRPPVPAALTLRDLRFDTAPVLTGTPGTAA